MAQLKFTAVRWKNFLSTGNAFTELKLDEHRSTLVLGENGSGKSTMLDAICFALFGKAFRNINKPQLVNSINQKNCRVEVDFTIGRHSYRVVRGIKPALFEIWVNDKMINQEASTKDYQKYLEESVLKLNFKSFTQIVILGSASFTPFMQLPAASRREIIEDILDIKIFTTMNVLLKERLGDLKDRITEAETNVKLGKQRVQMQEQHIESLLQDRTDRIAEIEARLVEVQNETAQMEAQLEKLLEERDAVQERLRDYKATQKEQRTVESSIDKLLDKVKEVQHDLAFYEKNDACPTCRQDIDAEFKEKIRAERHERMRELSESKRQLEDIQATVEGRLEEMEKANGELSRLLTETTAISGKIASNGRFVQAMSIEKHDLMKKVGNVEQEREKLSQMAREVLTAAELRSQLNADKHCLDVAATLLKDSGVKTRIIKKYLAPINKLVNKYLQAMDFFVHFELDETFKEVIRSRHRDEFSYESFSEGEKQRIDLALLFTWRTIAKMKNSASTNLLILDEIFDSSLDAAGTDYVMNLLNMMGEQVNVWVISHKGDQLADKFTHSIRFTKVQNYSIIA